MMHKNKKKILIVDDELDICLLISGILKQNNYIPAFATNLNDAQKAIDQAPPSLIILDNMLPDGHGIDFIPYVKKKYPFIKILMLTACDNPAYEKMAYGNGADYFIGKPINREIIFHALNKLMVGNQN